MLIDIEKLKKYMRRNGKMYTPSLLPEDLPVGKLGDCFDHCAIVATGRKYRYVEGITENPKKKGHWFIHSWLTDESGKLAYDPTWYSIIGTKRVNIAPTTYIGIQMDIEHLARFMSKTEYKSVIVNGWRNKELANKLIPNYEELLKVKKETKSELYLLRQAREELLDLRGMLRDKEIQIGDYIIKDDGYRLEVFKDNQFVGSIAEYKHDQYGFLFQDYINKIRKESFTLGMMKGVESSNSELELLRLARAELLDLRGMLCDFRGTFDPNMQKLKKYWNGPKPKWEKELAELKQELK